MARNPYEYLASLTEPERKRKKSDQGEINDCDLVVVGAGIAGTYCAWKLGEQNPDWNIQVYDAQERVGGRLRSVKLEGTEDFMIDLGEMRFRKKRHKCLWELIQEVGLGQDLKEFTTPEKEECMYFLRDKLLSHEDITNGTVPYQLNELERSISKDSTDLLNYWNSLIRITDPENSRKDTDKGVLNAYLEVTSLDAINYLADRDLHPSIYLSNPNFTSFIRSSWRQRLGQQQMTASCGSCPGLITVNVPPVLGSFYALQPRSTVLTEWLRSVSDLQMFTLKTGLQRIVEKVVERFLLRERSDKHKVLLSKKLTDVFFREDNEAVLTFNDETTIRAKKVILGLPKVALSKVNFWNEDLQKKINELIVSVVETPAMKTFLVYEKPWWRNYLKKKFKIDRKLKVVGTDSPLGTILEYGVDSNSGRAVLVCCDEGYRFKHYWDTITPVTPGDNSTVRPQVPAYHLELIRQLLSKVFDARLLPGGKLPDPVDSVRVEWSAECPAWHLYCGGCDPSQVMEDALKPLANRDLYVVGETFSDVQGWCEGALHTAQNLLDKYFQIKINNVLTDHIYL